MGEIGPASLLAALVPQKPRKGSTAFGWVSDFKKSKGGTNIMHNAQGVLITSKIFAIFELKNKKKKPLTRIHGHGPNKIESCSPNLRVRRSYTHLNEGEMRLDVDLHSK